MQPAFRILGPLEVELSERVVALGRRERALLGVLLLNAGEVVSVERLIDGVWGEPPPSSAKHMVHEYVSRLRQALVDGSRLETRAPGYVIACSDGELDANLFAELALTARASANAGDHAGALRSYEQALGLWRGDALAGVQLEGHAQIDVARLDEERRLVSEERIDSALALGQHRELIPELERHVRDEPLRERPRAQLMLALYRAGRQTDALERYRAGRALLVEQAGVEPGRELQRLERSILQHDPALELEPVIPGAGEASPNGTPVAVGARRRRSIVALAGAAAVAGVAAAAWFTISRDDSPSVAVAEGNSVAVIDAHSARPTASIPIDGGGVAGPSPSAVAAGAGSIWVANVDAHSVSRIDPAKQVVIDTIPVGHGPAGIAFGAGFVWVTNGLDGTVSKIDPATNTSVQTITVGNGPAGIAVGKRAVWVANSNDRSITRIDAATGTPGGAMPVPSGADGIAIGGESVWVTGQSSGMVTRIDAGGESVLETIYSGNGATAITSGFGSIWVANSLDGTVTRIDPLRNARRATIPVGNGPNGIAVTREGIWVSNELEGSLSTIDPARNTPIRNVPTGNRPEGIVAQSGALFVAVRTAGTGHYGGTLTVLGTPIGKSGSDPALAYTPESNQVLTLTNDGLVGYRRVSGNEGSRLVPDLAVAIPAPTDGGRTYRFRLRPGIHYSTGALVRPQDFRRALERSLVRGNSGGHLSLVVGARACQAAPTRPCDLSRGIVTDSRSNTVVFHLTSPDPDFLHKLTLASAAAVPEGTPLEVSGPVPATGPYMIASWDPKAGIRLVRNPWFREWSPIAQPRGFPDEIVRRFGDSADRHARSVLNGGADLALDTSRSSKAMLASLQTRHASQLELSPAPATFFLILNTRVAPFDDVRVRQALNYAVDRRRLRDLTVGPGNGSLTCQVLPPNAVGYRRYCPYTARPSASQAWRAPDLARARRLVRASGTAGQHVTVWLPPWIRFKPSAAKYVVSVLESLGYKARYRSPRFDPYEVQDKIRLQLGFYAWAQDFASPAGFFVKTLTCGAYNRANIVDNTNTAEFCDPAIDAEIARAQSLQASDPAASSRLWSKVERDVVDRAPWVPYANLLLPELRSERVGNYQYHSILGTLLAQLWVR